MQILGTARLHLSGLAVFLVSCAATEGSLPGECGDAADNDGDGLFDCTDPDCYNAPDCADDDSSDDEDGGDGDDGGDDDGDEGGDDGGDDSDDDGGDDGPGGDEEGGEDDGGDDGGFDTNSPDAGSFDGTYCGTWNIVVSTGSDSDSCSGDAELYINGSFTDMLGMECSWTSGSLGYDPVEMTLTGELNTFTGEMWGTSLSGIEKGTAWEGTNDSVDASGEISGDIQDTSGAATGEATFEVTMLTSGFECP
jgi:hypothetical protein